VEQIWWRRSHDTWCTCIQAIDDSLYAPGEANCNTLKIAPFEIELK